MIVAIDTLFMAGRFRYTGTGKYLRHVLSELLKIIAEGSLDIQLHGFRSPKENWVDNGFASPFLHVHEARALLRKRLWMAGGLAMNVARARPDLLFLPTAQGSIPTPFCPPVTTILDAIPNRLPPELVDAGLVAKHMAWMNAKLSDAVITISECSKRDLQEFYGLPLDKVHVIYLGYDKRLYNEASPDPQASASLLDRFGIRSPFVVCHGMVQLRKNVHRLIQAWDQIHEKRKDFDAQLILVGPMGHGHEEILRLRENSPNRDQIIFTGALPDAELPTLIKNASLCVIPSLYEGFCLPMVEAMACGIPTIASNSSCMPEISGGALEYFDPYSIAEISAAVQRALCDSDLRSRLRQAGVARAAQFSWQRCAVETLGVLLRAHGSQAG